MDRRGVYAIKFEFATHTHDATLSVRLSRRSLRQVSCTADQVQRYRGRLSGPLLDRLDLHIDVPRVPTEVMRAEAKEIEPSAKVGSRAFAGCNLPGRDAPTLG